MVLSTLTLHACCEGPVFARCKAFLVTTIVEALTAKYLALDAFKSPKLKRIEAIPVCDCWSDPKARMHQFDNPSSQDLPVDLARHQMWRCQAWNIKSHPKREVFRMAERCVGQNRPPPKKKVNLQHEWNDNNIYHISLYIYNIIHHMIVNTYALKSLYSTVEYGWKASLWGPMA